MLARINDVLLEFYGTLAIVGACASQTNLACFFQ